MRKNYRLLKKLNYEKNNPVEDNNVYFYIDHKTNDKLEYASIAVDRRTYVARDKDINKIPWQISK